MLCRPYWILASISVALSLGCGRVSKESGEELTLGQSVAAGHFHVCALWAGTPLCWGGEGDTRRGVTLAHHQRFVALAAGANNSCGLRGDGSVACWGELDDPGVTSDTFVALALGDFHGCGLRQDGTVSCWGSNEQGELEVPTDRKFVQIAASSRDTCGLEPSGYAVCWGANGPNVSALPRDERFLQIALGINNACALRLDGTAACWTDAGSLAFGAFYPPEERLVALSVGALHSCGLRPDGTPVCWGQAEQHVPMPTNESFVELSCGGAGHTCARREDGVVRCWGYNTGGQTEVPRALAEP